MDQYVEDILNKAQNADQVTIEPNGEWSTDKDPPAKANGYGGHADDSDDDLVEIPDYRIKAIKSEFAPHADLSQHAARNLPRGIDGAQVREQAGRPR